MEKITLDEISTTPETTKPLPTSKAKKNKNLFPILIVVAVVLGLVGGSLLASQNIKTSPLEATGSDTIPTDQGSIKVGTIYGSKDENNFPDKAEGVLVAGGVGGEGTHHLVRVGGDSQNVYLSSSVVDLDLITGARVQVWGQTMNAKKAGWLMDVGRLKVLELSAPMPE